MDHGQIELVSLCNLQPAFVTFSRIVCISMNVMTALWYGLDNQCLYHSNQHPAAERALQQIR